MKDLTKMKIGDICRCDDWKVTRVPGGWIFRLLSDHSCAVFVPLDTNAHNDFVNHI